MGILLVIVICIGICIVFQIYCDATVFSLQRTVQELQDEMSRLRKIIATLKTADTSTPAQSPLSADVREERKSDSPSIDQSVSTAPCQSPVPASSLLSPSPAAPKVFVKNDNPIPPHSAVSPHKSSHRSPFSVWIRKQLTIESVISKLGILLLLIGVAFIFKLAHERGLIGRELILAAGFAAGLALTGFGFFVRQKKRIILSQVLFGGSIAVFYITAFAAYMRYNILNDFSAFLFLAVITLIAYLLAAAVSSVSVSIIGLAGSLLIPFVIGFDFFNFLSFGLYVFAVSILSMLLYFFKRWRIVQFISNILFSSVLVRLLSQITLTVFDAQLFLVLVLLLWAIHLIPDFYFHLAGKERASDKKTAPAAALINYGFSLFFVFKLAAYQPVPDGSLYVVFTFFYALFSYICLKKEKPAVLGYTYTALALISGYVTIVDVFQYDIRPAAVLGAAVFLSWLWRKERDRVLKVGIYITALIGYIMAFSAITVKNEALSVQSFALYAGLYAAPMSALVFLQKERIKTVAQTLVFQLYAVTVCCMLFSKWVHERDNLLFGLRIAAHEMVLFYALIILLLFSLYSVLHYYRKIPGKAPYFYEQSLYALPVLMCGFIAVYELERWGTRIFMPLSIQCICAGGLLALSFFKGQSGRNRFIYRTAFFIIMLKLFLFDGTRLGGSFYWGLFFAGVFVLLIDRFYLSDVRGTKKMKTAGKLIVSILAGIYYPFIYLPVKPYMRIGIPIISTSGMSFTVIPLVIDICNALIFLNIIAGFVSNRKVRFSIITLVFVFFSFMDIYIPTKNNGFLTILWGFYSIISFVYFLKKTERTLVYTSLFFIIIVSAKLIFIDLQTISIVSKTITSIVLGSALLILSYAVQPMLKKFEKSGLKTDTMNDKHPHTVSTVRTDEKA